MQQKFPKIPLKIQILQMEPCRALHRTAKRGKIVSDNPENVQSLRVFFVN